ncbi:hypothetical protein QO010_002527 [Caulobacter ginsengisoli]|uniref:Uncharacterized protein n=1 Tax=Caulobacter ginsengisoli TaxID=400775 RepID=A0ABU0IUD1_9CAUL|nr:hypothetical protein [Caulobacter ginsengisoli]
MTTAHFNLSSDGSRLTDVAHLADGRKLVRYRCPAKP